MKYKYEITYVRENGMVASEVCLTPKEAGEVVAKLLSGGTLIKKVSRIK